MTPPTNAALKLLPPTNEGQALPSEPRSDGRQALPDPLAMARWRQEADVRAEALLTEFDAAILSGQDAAGSAHRLLNDFMTWTRRSIRVFDRAQYDRVDSGACASELTVWSGLGDLAAQAADVEPGGVDRFLRIWLAVVHEATATGEAWLYAR